MTDWLGEIELGITGSPVSMGVRKLGKRPWLFIDKHTEEELTLKAKLSKDPKSEVFLSQPGTQQASECAISLIEQTGIELIHLKNLHPLERAGLSIQEDLCLVQRSSKGWILEAASLSFPSLWKLSEKLGKNMAAVHGPVDDYPEFLEKKVEGFFDRLSHDPVWRRNWFIHSDDNLYQPGQPKEDDPVITSDLIGQKLFVRSERQTLRALEIPGWILFTIRVQQTPLEDLIDSRREDFTSWIHNAPESFHRHKALRKEQVGEILKALG
ncbi:MAG: hypothetical protein CL421_08290 [Acidimicrobiaceae bacterium]|nr:hypothetical protein [Acidimicrobiaceae bacterium]